MIKLLKGNKNRYCISFHNSRNSRGQTKHHMLTSILLTRSSINTNNNKIFSNRCKTCIPTIIVNPFNKNNKL